jgi:hypothetical protein
MWCLVSAVGFVASMLTSADAAHAGWIIDEVVRGGASAEPTNQRLFVQTNRLKVVIGPDARPTQAMLMDLEAQTITHVDYGNRTYMKATVREYGEAMRQAMGGMRQMQSRLKALEEQLRSLPPDQRRALEAVMKQAEEPTTPAEDCIGERLDVKPIDRRITVAGYDARGYHVFASGKPASEVYVAPAITAAREIDPQKLEQMVGEILKALPHCPTRGQMVGTDPAWKLLKEGYPVRSIGLDNGRITEVVKAERRSIGASEFEPPAGFTRQTPKEMMGGK